MRSMRFSRRNRLNFKLLGWLLLGLLILGGGFFALYSFGEDFLPKKEVLNPAPEKDYEFEVRESFLPLNLELKELDLSNSRELVATFSGRLTVVFSRLKSLDFQVNTLQFILWRSKIEGKVPRFVDLRYNKPVLKF